MFCCLKLNQEKFKFTNISLCPDQKKSTSYLVFLHEEGSANRISEFGELGEKERTHEQVRWIFPFFLFTVLFKVKVD